MQCSDAGGLNTRMHAVKGMTLDEFKDKTNIIALLKARFPGDTSDQLATKLRNMHQNVQLPQFWSLPWLDELQLNTSAPGGKSLVVVSLSLSVGRI